MKTIVIKRPKCPECDTEFPTAAKYLHGLPHTYYLPCPKCGYDPMKTVFSSTQSDAEPGITRFSTGSYRKFRVSTKQRGEE